MNTTTSTTKTTTEAAAATTAPQESLLDQAFAVETDARDQMMAKLTAGFDDREAFETLHSPANTEKLKKLRGYRAKMVLPGIAALAVATSLDPNFMNGFGTSEKQRFNIYAIDKMADLLHGLNSGHIQKAVNRCIVASLFALDKAEITITNDIADAAVSANIKVSKELDAIMTRHTAAPGTAPTQRSSTMSALALLGVVKNTGSSKRPVWQLTESAATIRLKEVIGA